MALYKRGDTWWINLSHKGQRIQKTTGTSDKVMAERVHDELKASLWRNNFLKEKPKYTWVDAVVRWLDESQHKKSIINDIQTLKWLDSYFSKLKLCEVTRDRIEMVAKIKEKTNVKPSTVNRMLEIIRAILRKAEHEWEWLDKAPIIRMRKENSQRIRWLTYEEAAKLIEVLPEHLADMTQFSLATGLRQANVLNLQWQEIDLIRKHAWVHHDEAKAKKAIPIPLNEVAIDVLQRRKSIHPQFVFTYDGNRIKECNTKAWRKALKKVGIENFRWHDLRHTWASWHVQNGTSLHELQQLGGWASYEMVLRYAHLSSNQLSLAASRVVVTNLLQSRSSNDKAVA